MKNISFLYSTSKRTIYATGLLLADNTVAGIDKEMVLENEKASDKVKPVIANTTVEDIIWWWPSGNAFREIYGVSEFGVINVLTNYGFTIAKSARLKHDQVLEDSDPLNGYMEIKLAVSDEHYEFLCKQYGVIKCVESLIN